MTFTVPAVHPKQLRMRGLMVLVRPEQPPAARTVLWRPNHREAANKVVGFVLYGRVLRVGPGEDEPVWTSRGGELRFRAPTVREGDHVAWRHGFGPSLELIGGTHFAVHEDGIVAEWWPEHEHSWRFEREGETYSCECGATDDRLETRWPTCGDLADGPRVGTLDPSWEVGSWTAPASRLIPPRRTVLVEPELPPMIDAGIWTPHQGMQEGPALGFVSYGRALRVGPGGDEPCWITDRATGRRCRDGQQRGAVTTSYSIAGREGPEVRKKAYPTKLAYVPSTTEPGERVVWALGWERFRTIHEAGRVVIHEDALVARWTPAHACCVHMRLGAGFRCCSCGAAVDWPGEFVEEAVLGRDPTLLQPTSFEPEDPKNMDTREEDR